MVFRLVARAGLVRFLGLGMYVYADQVVLRNGRTLEGLVVRETEGAIVLDLGAGTMEIRRPQILAVHRASEAENARLRAQWQERYFLHRKFVPSTMQALAGGLRSLLDSREGAKTAQAALTAAVQEESQLLEEMANLRRRLAATSARLSAIPLPTDPRDVRAYNAVVAENNQLVVALSVREKALGEVRRRQDDLRQRLADYAQHVAAFEAQFAETVAQHDAATDPEGARFLERAALRLRELSQEFSSSTVSVECEGSHAWVQATINGRARLRLLLDTGAAMVSLSECSAQLAGVTTNGAEEVTVTLADGTQRRALALILESLEVGNERVERVPAVVFRGTGLERTDGLLGMSFLRHFIVSLDAASCRLVLKRFAPQ